MNLPRAVLALGWVRAVVLLVGFGVAACGGAGPEGDLPAGPRTQRDGGSPRQDAGSPEARDRDAGAPDAMTLADAAQSDAGCMTPGCAASDCDGGACAAELVDLVASVGVLRPAFDPAVHTYDLELGIGNGAFTLTPSAATAARIEIDGQELASGSASATISVAGIGATAEVTIDVTAAGVSSSYVVRAQRMWRQALFGKASNTGINDHLGYSVAVSGDTLVVGAPDEAGAGTSSDPEGASDGLVGAGAAYVFRRAGDGGWQQEAYLKADNAGFDDAFGGAVAISGDTLVIGAPQEASSAQSIDGDASNDDAPYAGAAYVFRRTAGAWQQEAYLKADNNDPAGGDWFGVSVAISGNVIVVGADQEDGGASGVNGASDENGAGSGAAYVFRFASGAWQQEAYLKASNTGGMDGFGASVAIAGDAIAVGAPGEDSAALDVDGDEGSGAAQDSGAAYVFRYALGAWQQEAYLKASNTEAGDGFGGSVAIASDLVAVGAELEDASAQGVDGDGTLGGADDSGAVYLFRHAGSGWAKDAYLKASNPAPGDRFGAAVAAGDGLIVVGAHDEDGSAPGVNGDESVHAAPHAGAAYVFRDDAGAWDQEAYIKAGGPSLANARFGFSVAVDAGMIAIGARDEPSGGTGIDPEPGPGAAASGAVYAFE